MILEQGSFSWPRHDRESEAAGGRAVWCRGRCVHSGDGPGLLLGHTGERVEHQAACLTQGFSEYLFLSPFLPSPFGGDLGPGKLAGVSSTMIFTVCPLYPQLVHPWSQPTSDLTYLGKKLQKVSKSKA